MSATNMKVRMPVPDVHVRHVERCGQMQVQHSPSTPITLNTKPTKKHAR